MGGVGHKFPREEVELTLKAASKRTVEVLQDGSMVSCALAAEEVKSCPIKVLRMEDGTEPTQTNIYVPVIPSS